MRQEPCIVKFIHTLLNVDLKKIQSEATLYNKSMEENDILIVSIYVDDILYTRSNQEMLDEFKEHKKKKYDMADLGLLHHFLGI